MDHLLYLMEYIVGIIHIWTLLSLVTIGLERLIRIPIFIQDRNQLSPKEVQ